MLLVIDIGNTNITLGVFDGNDLLSEYRIESDANYLPVQYAKLLKDTIGCNNISHCIIASVVCGLDEILHRAVNYAFDIDSIILASKLKLSIKINLDNPLTLGVDRIANDVAAYSKYKNYPVVVVDFGTATTFDVINSKGELMGGLIAPGIDTQLKSLNEHTSKLPYIKPEKSISLLATNTKDAILSGVIRGTACMADGMLAQYKKELGENTKVVITGGFADIISDYMTTSIDTIDKTLTLKGLREIYELNSHPVHL